MKNQLIIVILMCSMSQLGLAQNYAGPDTTTCTGSPVMIGMPSVDPSYCYLWDAAEGISESERYVAQPTVTPKHTTVYRVTVRGPQFLQIGSDQVEVFVDFGPINTSPSYINIGETESIQSIAELQEDGGRFFTWLVVDQDNTGCFINTFSGEVTNCTTTGKFKFKAQAINDLNCDAEYELEVNLGVKDVIATDAKKPNRKAKASEGETLKIVNAFESGSGNENRTINVQAIPNKGGIFGAGTPDWTGNLDGSPVGDDLYVGNIEIVGQRFIKAAPDKTVYITYEDPMVESSAVEANLEFIQNTLDYIAGAGLVDDSCPPIGGYLGFSVPGLSISITEEKKTVEKFADPGVAIAYKYTFTPAGFGVCGEVAVPLFGIPIPRFGISLEGFIGLGGSINLGVAVSYDPSEKQPYGGEVSLEAALDLSAGFKIPIEVAIGGIEGAAFLSTGAKATATLKPPNVEAVFEIGGLSGTLSGTIWIGVPSTNYTFSINKTILPSATLGPYQLFTLKN